MKLCDPFRSYVSSENDQDLGMSQFVQKADGWMPGASWLNPAPP